MNIDTVTINPVTFLNKVANPSIRQLGSVAREDFSAYLKQVIRALPSLQGPEITPALHQSRHLLAEKVTQQHWGGLFHSVSQCSHRLMNAYQEVMNIAL